MSLLTFRKDERLSKKKSIDRLFREGSSFFLHPFKVYWLLGPLEAPVSSQLLIIVGKRSFKRAVDRNRIRRQVRENFRLQKQDFNNFLAERNEQCLLGFIYSSHQFMETQEIDKKIKYIIRRLKNDIDAKLNNKARTLSEQ